MTAVCRWSTWLYIACRFIVMDGIAFGGIALGGIVLDGIFDVLPSVVFFYTCCG